MIRRRIGLSLSGALASAALLLGLALPAQAAPDYVRVELLELYCLQQSEGSHDEAYIKYYDSKVWPGGSIAYQTMGAGYVRSLADARQMIILTTTLTTDDITLWDSDSTSSDDRIARFHASGAEVNLGDRYSVYFDANAYYVLKYRVVDI